VTMYHTDGTPLYKQTSGDWKGYVELNNFWTSFSPLLEDSTYQFPWLVGNWRDMFRIDGLADDVQLSSVRVNSSGTAHVEAGICGRVLTTSTVRHGIEIMIETEFQKDFSVGLEGTPVDCERIETTDSFKQYVAGQNEADTLIVIPLHPDTLMIAVQHSSLDSLILDAPTPVFADEGRFLIRIPQ